MLLFVDPPPPIECRVLFEYPLIGPKQNELIMDT